MANFDFDELKRKAVQTAGTIADKSAEVAKIVAEKAYLDFDTLFARVDKVNVASQRLLEKNGFTQIRDNGSQYVYTKSVLATPVYKLWKKEKT